MERHRRVILDGGGRQPEDWQGPSPATSLILYAKTHNLTAAYLFDSDGAFWNPMWDAGWGRFVKAVPCNSQGEYLPGYTVSGPFVYIEFPFPVAGTGIPGVRLLPIATVIRYLKSDAGQEYGDYTMDGFCLDAPLGNHFPWCEDQAIGEALLWWNANMTGSGFDDDAGAGWGYPSGWHWCDGTTGVGKNSITVPNFRDRVVKVASSGSVGGYLQHQLYNHDRDINSLDEGANLVVTSGLHTNSKADSNWPPFRTTGLAMWIGVKGF